MGGPVRLLFLSVCCAALTEAYYQRSSYTRTHSAPSEDQEVSAVKTKTITKTGHSGYSGYEGRPQTAGGGYSHLFSNFGGGGGGGRQYRPSGENESSRTVVHGDGGRHSFHSSWTSSSSSSSGSQAGAGAASNAEATSMLVDHESGAADAHHAMTFKGGCRGAPPSPINADMRCSSKSGCQATCMSDYRFPNGVTKLTITCADGTWQVEGAEWEVIPACEPICMPACLHGGKCVAPGRCRCLNNYSGPHCQFENKPCQGFPALVRNSQRSCNSTACTVTCATNHEFPDGTTSAKIVCKDGTWQPLRTDFVAIPDCRAICKPPCKNGGKCLSYNLCQCPQEYRGSQCQYSVEACSAKKLVFNGGYNCSGTGDTFSCVLFCPSGIKFESPPAAVYKCDYATGKFYPANIPQCVYGENMKVIDMGGSSQSFYNTSSSASAWSLQGGHHGIYEESYYDGEDDEEWVEIITKTRYRKKHGNKYKYQDGLYNETNYGEIETSSGQYGIHEEGRVGYIVMKPKPAICFTWAGAHYKTFDGQVYSFVSDCAYTLARDAVDNTFNIMTKSSPSCFKGDQLQCHKMIRIFVNNEEYSLTLSDGVPILANTIKKLPIPISLPGMRVELTAHYVKVTMDSAGVILKWDAKQLVQVEASQALWNRTSGLCGLMDGDESNDMLSKDSEASAPLAGMRSFAESWRVSDLAAVDSCSGAELDDQMQKLETTCRTADRKTALKFCKLLLRNKKFSQCFEVEDVELMFKSCVFDYCNCKLEDPSKCACETLSVFTKECKFRGVSIPKGWRNLEMCPMQCIGGKVYMECGSSVHLTCESMNQEAVETSECEEGCFCPSGTVLHAGQCIEPERCTCRLRGKEFESGAQIRKDCNTCTCERGQWSCTEVECASRCGAIGDSHYTTFNGRRYDFMGTCSYYLVKGEDYSVQIENVACSGHQMKALAKPHEVPSCTKTVTIHVGGKIIKLKQNLDVTVDDVEVTKFPLNLGVAVIRPLSLAFIAVDLANGLQVMWDGLTRVYVDAPATHRGKTSGLCGTFNANQENDFWTPEGDVEQSVASFANKWKTSDLCQDISQEPKNHPCDVNPHNKPIAEKLCKTIKSDLFSKCHWYVDPETFYQECMFDMCSCNGGNRADNAAAGRCLCPVLGAYATECMRQGVTVEWRSHVQECESRCPAGQTYQMCGDSCAYSCRDLQTSLEHGSSFACKRGCSEGCRCPEGRYLDTTTGECVTRGQCPCEYLGQDYRTGEQLMKMDTNGTARLCTCTGSALSCRKASVDEITQHIGHCDVRKNLEFTECEPVHQMTCTNMRQHLPTTASVTPQVCKPGCRCKKGYVLDSKSGYCVKPENCPCHHGGRSYEHGATIQDGCNTCTCEQGAWQCGNRKCSRSCSAWGDSHFDTFDGRAFDFQGACDYVMSKGSLSPNDAFEVTIQNVPCGSLGETCSKSVTLKVGAESVTLVHHKPLPVLVGYKRIAMRQISRMVFLDVEDLGLVLQWDRGTMVYLKLDVRWKGQIKGLCGDYNDNEADDFKSPSGGEEASPREFGDSWRLHDYCVKAKELEESCEKHPGRKAWALRQCGLLKSEPFSRCHAEVAVERYLARCLFDACACDQGGDCECLCTALAAYAHRCAMRGIPIKWRTPELCPMQCDEKCSEYTPCLSPCPVETCDNSMMKMKEHELCEQDTCVEGCQLKPCPKGHIYLNSSGLECVPKSQCQSVCLEINGAVYYEGDLISGDECQSCYCSRNKKVCKGQPCAPVITDVTKPFEEINACTTGWSSWFNLNEPTSQATKTPTKGKLTMTINEVEHLPKFSPMVKTPGAGACPVDAMVDIECRTANSPHQLANQTLLDVKCSLEKGLICKGSPAKPCVDFEIRVKCYCGRVTAPSIIDKPETTRAPPTTHKVLDRTPCDPVRPHEAHPTECHLFYHCEPNASGGYWLVQKTCGNDMMYNPIAMVCDWPYSVKTIRPDCDGSATTVSHIDVNIEVEVPQPCPAGEVWSPCAVPCKRACIYYEYLLIKDGRCSPVGEYEHGCRAGCMSESRNLQCPPGQVWRDANTCVELHDCTCRTSSGKIVKPGEVIQESPCKICQCVDNHYSCDVSACGPGNETGIHTTTFDFHLGTTRLPDFHGIDENLDFTTHRSYSEKDELMIVINTATPPVDCHADHLTGLIEELSLPDSAFSSSSSLGKSFLPFHGKLNSRVTATSGGSWSPKESDKHQYLQITMPRLEPVYGIILKGSPIYDQYVTSYKILHSTDGVAFSYVTDKKGKPQVFKGSVDRSTPIKQIFKRSVEAKMIRLKPLTWHEGIAVRFEVLGCRLSLTTTTPPQLITITPHYFTEPFDLKMCDDAMGIQNGEMKLNQITVSSEHSMLGIPKLGGNHYWRPLINRPTEYIMFDFLEPRNLTGVKIQGGPEGWVKSFRALYSHDKRNWLPIMSKDGHKTEFLGNHGSEDVQTNAFPKPVRARYLKLVPTKWYQNIVMRVEPLGCFQTYPLVIEPLPLVTLPPYRPTNCNVCPGIIARQCSCYEPAYWDGDKCVKRAHCPCMMGHVTYAVGTHYETEECMQCTCSLGGIAHCLPKICEACPENQRSVITSNCGCLCKSCASDERLCPTANICIQKSSWCNGVQDCPDDETGCAATTTVTPEIEQLEKLTCPPVVCPPNYKVVYQSSKKPYQSNKEDSPMFNIGYRPLEAPHRQTKGGIKSKSVQKPMRMTEAPSDSAECLQFQCVPEKPSTELQKTPKECPKVQCPRGYTIEKEEPKSTEKFDCPKYACYPPPKPDASCNITGRTFNTFDGTHFKMDICSHVLARDMQLDYWHITMEKNCTLSSSTCPVELIIVQDGESVRLLPDLRILLDGYRYTVDQTQRIGFKRRAFLLSKLGDSLFFVSNKYGFWVIWEGNRNVKIGLSGKLSGTVDGLCGFFNHRASDDKQRPDGTQASSTAEFADSWATTSSTPALCEPSTCPAKLQAKALEMCNSVRKEPLSICSSVIDLDKWVSSCLETICTCLQHNVSVTANIKADEDKCRCQALQAFAVECQAANNNVDLQNWRAQEGCPCKTCPAPLVYRDCYRRRCEPSCESLRSGSSGGTAPLSSCPTLPGICFPGCYCPDGMVRKGEDCVLPTECRDCVCDGFGTTKYVTYDRKDFNFAGNCTYLLTRDKLLGLSHTFQVYVTNGPCPELPTDVCTQALHIFYGPHKLTIKRGKAALQLDVLVDGKHVSRFPHRTDWLRITSMPGRDITLLLPGAQLELSVFYHNVAFMVRTPSRTYGGRLEGLCGDCDNDPENDFLSKDGSFSFDTSFASSWVASEDHLGFKEEGCRDLQLIAEVCHKPKPVEDLCLLLSDPDAFAQCNKILDPLTYVQACREQMCSATDVEAKQRVVCASLEAYDRECKRQGVCSHWRKSDLCPYPACKTGLTYDPCGLGCDVTCANADMATNPALCKEDMSEGCFCPRGLVHHNNSCVEPRLCHPCDTEGHFAGDRWQVDKCTSCCCSEISHQVQCSVTSCPEPESLCSSDQWAVKLPTDEEQCCDKYTCVTEAKGTPPTVCPEPKAPTCGPDQKVNLDEDDGECPKYICQCIPPESCPPLLDSKELKAGMEKKMTHNGCCPRVSYSCNENLCLPPPVCPEFYERLEKPAESGECCPMHTCIPPRGKCLYESKYTGSVNGGETYKKESERKVYLKMPGEKWTDGPCRECQCVMDNTNNASYLADCSAIQCPQLKDHPDLAEYQLRLQPEPYKCCAAVRRYACLEGDEVHQIGETWPSGDACKTISCTETPSGEALKMEKVETCKSDCPKGSFYKPPKDPATTCCGACVQRFCVIGEKVYAPGEVWMSQDKCTEFSCENLNSDQVVVKSSKLSCPDVSNCKKDRIYRKGCCEYCNATAEALKTCLPQSLALSETIGLVTYKLLSHGVCRNLQSIKGFTGCQGHCPSGTLYNPDTFKHDSNCKCCVPSKYEDLQITLTCTDGFTLQKHIDVPSNCNCSPCSEQASSDLTRGQPKTTSLNGDLVEVFDPQSM